MSSAVIWQEIFCTLHSSMVGGLLHLLIVARREARRALRCSVTGGSPGNMAIDCSDFVMLIVYAIVINLHKALINQCLRRIFQDRL